MHIPKCRYFDYGNRNIPPPASLESSKLGKYLESTRIRKGHGRPINPVNELSIVHII